MAIEYSEIGTKAEVGKLDRHRKRNPAQVVRFPFYVPDKASPVRPAIPLRTGLPCTPPRWQASSGYSWEVFHGG